jgi:hypothetical protein
MSVTESITPGPAVEPDPSAIAAKEASLTALGESLEEPVFVDYFAFDESHRVPLPDGRQYVEHRTLNEGQKKKYQNSVNRDVVIRKATGDAQMRMAQGDERHALLTAAISGWFLLRKDRNTGQVIEVPFNTRTLNEFLEKAPPRVIEAIEKDIRKVNPWLMAELTLEDIDKEIAELQELRQKKVEEEQGKSTSSSK